MLRESATEMSVRKNSRGASPLEVRAERHLVSLAWRDIGLLDFEDAPSGFGVDPLPWTLSAWRRRVTRHPSPHASAGRIRRRMRRKRRTTSAPYRDRAVSGPVRVMLDTNVFDEVLDHPCTLQLLNGLTERNLIVILTTHVQADEIAAIPDAKRERRAAIEAVYAQLIMTEISTSGAICGISKVGLSSLGDGSGSLCIGDIMRSNTRDAEDALIAITANKAREGSASDGCVRRPAQRQAQASDLAPFKGVVGALEQT